VSNQTGEAIRVYVQLAGEDGPRTWDLDVDQAAYLTIDDDYLAADQVLILAESATNLWDTYKSDPLVLVPEPYLSDTIETYTLTFTP
jgi:hypothetical protein